MMDVRSQRLAEGRACEIGHVGGVSLICIRRRGADPTGTEGDFQTGSQLFLGLVIINLKLFY